MANFELQVHQTIVPKSRKNKRKEQKLETELRRSYENRDLEKKFFRYLVSVRSLATTTGNVSAKNIPKKLRTCPYKYSKSKTLNFSLTSFHFRLSSIPVAKAFSYLSITSFFFFPHKSHCNCFRVRPANLSNPLSAQAFATLAQIASKSISGFTGLCLLKINSCREEIS